MSKKWIVSLVAVALLSGFYFFSYAESRPLYDASIVDETHSNLELAPIDQAFTMVRRFDGQMLLVTDVNGDDVFGVALEQKDVISAYQALGKEGLSVLPDEKQRISVSFKDLIRPMDEVYPHIAAGTNYSEHAEEVGHEGDPFLFPKLSRASNWNSPVQHRTRLDYELELCAVPLKPVQRGEKAEFGYVLCGDFTGRWELIRAIDTDTPMGISGFAEAKGGPTMLPVGPFFVIPRNDNFYTQFDMSLYVNGQMRQVASPSQMIWSPDVMMEKVFDHCDDGYRFKDEQVALFDCNTVPAGTILLTGTPGGVMFNFFTFWNPDFYLKEGDLVTSFGRYLGRMENRIVAAE